MAHGKQGQLRLGVVAALATLAAALMAPGTAGAWSLLPYVGAPAALSSNVVRADRPPVNYTVTIGSSFWSIEQVDFLFQFGSGGDALNPKECVQVTGGFSGAYSFCNLGKTDQRSQVLSFPCTTYAAVCDAYRDGADAGQISVGRSDQHKGGAVRITSLTVKLTVKPIEEALADAAAQLGVSRDQLVLKNVEAKIWGDTSLGCPQPGKGYLQVLTSGYLVVIDGAGHELEYHTDAGTQIVLCRMQ